MKKFFAILLSVMLVLPVLSVMATAEDAIVIEIDRINNYDWTNKDFQSDVYTPTAASAGEILMATSANGETVADRIGGAWFTWWYKVLAEATSDGQYVVIATDGPGSTGYEAWQLSATQFVILCNTGYASTEPAGNAQDAANLASLAVDDVLTLSADLASLQEMSGALTDVKVTKVAADVEEDEEPGTSTPVTNVALGKSYTTNEQFRMGGADVGWGWDPNAPICYPDEDGKTMTDGILPADGAGYTDAEFAGWTGTHPTAYEKGYNYITIDLGETYDLAKFVLWYGTKALSNGIGAPNSVSVYVSADNETWTEVGTATPANDESVVNECVIIEGNVTGRYVEFRTTSGTWVFLSEAEVYNAGSTTTTVKEEIAVDGDLSDNGWAAEGWTEVTPDNGYWQAVPETDTISYSYQLRTDDTKLYAAFIVDCAAVEGGNGAGTNVRFWINSNDEATVYTHFYDVCIKEGVTATVAKYNKSTTANDGANIENSTINAVLTSEGDKTFVEFSVDLAEFNGAEGFNFFTCVSNKVNENVCLYYPAAVEGENRLSNLPYNVWYAEGQATVDVEEIKLGEIVVNDKEDEEPAGPSVEELMKEALGEAPAAPKFDLVINAPESYEAGDDITVTVTIKNITAENGLHLLEFVLNYDNTKLLITNDIDEEEDNALVCIENLPKDWENFCKVANDYDENNEDGTTVNPLNDGVITATVFTAKNGAKFAITEDESLVFTFTFKALEDSKGDIGIVIPHAGVEGALNTNTGADKYEGNGTYAVIKAPVVEEPKPNDPVKPGDASNMIVFAIIALVAIAGSAVVIKTRK